VNRSLLRLLGTNILFYNSLNIQVSKFMYHCILSLASFCFCSIQHLHFTTRVFAHSAVSPFLGCLLVSANETRVCKWKHEQIELPAKPPDNFLRSNKSNINQERDPQIVWLPLHLFAAEPHIASFIWRQGPARRHDFTCSQLWGNTWGGVLIG